MLHILDAIATIESFSKGMDRETFLNDERTISAVLYQFVIIGEAVAAIDYELLDKYDYPWHKPRSFRNYIAHEYFGIELWVTWETVHAHLPELKALIQRMLREEF